MEKKEVKKWRDAEALRRYRMIAPPLEAEMDEGKMQQIREETAEKKRHIQKDVVPLREGIP